MNNLTKRIQIGRRKGNLIRNNRWMAKATAHYRKFNDEAEQFYKTLTKAWRYVYGMIGVGVLCVALTIYSQYNTYNILINGEEELAIEYKELGLMQKNATNAIAQSKAFDAIGMTLLESALGDSEDRKADLIAAQKFLLDNVNTDNVVHHYTSSPHSDKCGPCDTFFTMSQKILEAWKETDEEKEQNRLLVREFVRATGKWPKTYREEFKKITGEYPQDFWPALND